MTLTLIRVPYGKKDTPPELREYKIDGVGAVGTLTEYKEVFPGEDFKIIDEVSK